MANAGNCFTAADEQQGYPNTKAALQGYTDSQLELEYHEMLKASFDRMFGHNAAKMFNLVCDELLSRGISELPNIFGSITVKPLRRYV